MAPAMFYTTTPDEALRFGDIVHGFALSWANVDKPPHTQAPYACEVDVSRPLYASVLSPCCSIGDGVIALSPLVEVPARLLGNPFFSDDLTRVNSRVKPEQSVSPEAWQKLGIEEKERRFARGPSYTFVHFFVYAPHDLLKEYSVATADRPITLGHYLVDFRRIAAVLCKQVNGPRDSPSARSFCS